MKFWSYNWPVERRLLTCIKCPFKEEDALCTGYIVQLWVAQRSSSLKLLSIFVEKLPHPTHLKPNSLWLIYLLHIFFRTSLHPTAKSNRCWDSPQWSVCPYKASRIWAILLYCKGNLTRETPYILDLPQIC